MFSFVIFSEEPEFAAEIEKQVGASGEARVAAVISDPDQLLGALKSEKPAACSSISVTRPMSFWICWSLCPSNSR